MPWTFDIFIFNSLIKYGPLFEFVTDVVKTGSQPDTQCINTTQVEQVHRHNAEIPSELYARCNSPIMQSARLVLA